MPAIARGIGVGLARPAGAEGEGLRTRAPGQQSAYQVTAAMAAEMAAHAGAQVSAPHVEPCIGLGGQNTVAGIQAGAFSVSSELDYLSSLGTLRLLLDAGQGITTSSGDVSDWASQVGAYSFANAANRPAYQATGWSNGLPQVQFVAAQSETLIKLLGIPSASGNDWTCIVVYDQVGDVSIAGSTLLVNDTTALNLISPVRLATLNTYDGTAWRDGGPAATQGEQCVTWEIDSAGSGAIRYRRNGADLGSPGAYDKTWKWDGTVSIASIHGFLDIEIAQIVMYQGILSAGNIAAAEAYLRAKFGLP